MTKIGALIVSLSLALQLHAQVADPFQIYFTPSIISGLEGLQSFAVGQYEDKWLLLGGRLDGLHRRQPFASFDAAGRNTQIVVVDPVEKQSWAATLQGLPIAVQEQLSSTNMEFVQDGDFLYLIGGYGYSATSGNHTTYAALTAVDVPGTIAAVISGTNIAPFFRQVEDPQFQVTGGYLHKVNDTYYLVGGQKFIGRYNPMGPNHGPGFIQEYTNQIRKFTISDNGVDLVVTHLPGFTDENNLHRRDYNVAAQILPNGEEGLTAFSGVFRHDIDLPFLNAVTINSDSYFVEEGFSQYYNHYHCAHVPLYSEEANAMHTVFFGGIAQYYDSLGILVQDNNVPFVKTVARVTRDASGTMTEYKLPVEMPDWLGASAEFIPVPDLPLYPNGVVRMDALTQGDSVLIGHIYGGINSSAPNIFWINEGTQSGASSVVLEVWLTKTTGTATHEINRQSRGTLQLQVMPNPNNGLFSAGYYLEEPTDVEIELFYQTGKRVEHIRLRNQSSGQYRQLINLKSLQKGAYFIIVDVGYERAVQKIIVD